MNDKTLLRTGIIGTVVAVFSVISGVLLGLVHQNLALLVVRSAASSDAAEE